MVKRLSLIMLLIGVAFASSIATNAIRPLSAQTAGANADKPTARDFTVVEFCSGESGGPTYWPAGRAPKGQIVGIATAPNNNNCTGHGAEFFAGVAR